MLKFIKGVVISYNGGKSPRQKWLSSMNIAAFLNSRAMYSNLSRDNFDASDPETAQILLDSFYVHEQFITESEENSLVEEAQYYLKRLRYEFDHWDNAIHGFRETERRNWNEQNSVIIERVRQVAFAGDAEHMSLVHILDLAKEGYIKPHVDSVRFCGSTIAGINLLSPCVMRLVHEKDKTKFGDCLLKPRSLYIMTGASRYDFTHEILKAEESKFKGQVVPRDRRISVICRCEPEPQEDGNS